jgi:exodeoxyribonuclease-3
MASRNRQEAVSFLNTKQNKHDTRIKPMRLFSWNVNGVRAVIKKGFADFVAEYIPDILCLQETKAQPDQINLPFDGYHLYVNPAEKKGYSGVMVLTKEEPLNVTYGMGMAEHDTEGRVIVLEYEGFFLLNVYTPNSQRGLARLDYRTQEWDPAFLEFVKELENTKPVVMCGDFNCAHKEIDLENPKNNLRNAGFTIEERTEFEKLIQCGFVDTFREFTEEGGHYTWWSYMRKAREKNIGWRIDYFLISPAIRPLLQEAKIYPAVMGSDHCPISITLNGK